MATSIIKDNLKHLIDPTLPFQMTWTNNAYVSEESVKRCWVAKSGRIITIFMNLSLDKAQIATSQEIIIGYFAGVHCNGSYFQQVPFQTDPSKAMMMAFINTSSGIQVKACNYMGSGNLPLGFYRTTATVFSTVD